MTCELPLEFGGAPTEASAIEEAGWTDAVVTGAQPASARTTIPGIAAAVRWHITILDPFGSLAERLPHANDIATGVGGRTSPDQNTVAIGVI